MTILLQHKIFVGYFLLMAIISSMVAFVLHERNRVRKIENESIFIFQTQRDINTTHRYVTALATYGESVMVWDKEDSTTYRERHVRTDSMLQILRERCKDFIRPVRVDSLRVLLATKEVHLFQIMKASRKQRQTDSLLLHWEPAVTARITTRTITWKKKGIARFFGNRGTVQMPVVTTQQTTLDRALVALMNEQKCNMANYTYGQPADVQQGTQPETAHADCKSGRTDMDRLPKQGGTSESLLRTFLPRHHRPDCIFNHPAGDLVPCHTARHQSETEKQEAPRRNNRTEHRTSGYA